MPLLKNIFGPVADRGASIFGPSQEIGLQNAPSIFDQPINIGDLQRGSVFSPPKVTAPIAQQSPINAPSPGIATPDLDAYKAFLRQGMPQRRDNQLGKWGKALSLVAGTAEGYTTGRPSAGIETGMGLLQRPYREAMEDWQGKGGRLKELAGLDVGERQYQMERAKAERENALALNKDVRDTYELMSKMGLDQAQIRNYDSLIKDRNLELRLVDGKLHWMDKGTGTHLGEMRLGESPDEARQSAATIATAAENLRHTHEGDLERQRQTGREAIENIKGLVDRDTEEFKANLKRKNIGPEDYTKAQDAATQWLMNFNPDLADKIYTYDESGKLRRKEPPPSGSNVAGTPGYDPQYLDTNAEKLWQQHLQTRIGLMLGTEPQDPISDDGKVQDPREIILRRSAARTLQRNGLYINKRSVDEMTEDLRQRGHAQPGGTAVAPQGYNAPPQVTTPPQPINQAPIIPQSGAPQVPINPTQNVPNPMLSNDPNFGKLNPEFYNQMKRIPQGYQSLEQWFQQNYPALKGPLYQYQGR